MINYQTNQKNEPPVPQAARIDALRDLNMGTPYGQYNQTHADNLMAFQDQASAQYNLAASRANTDYEQRRRTREQQSVLAGLGLMYDARQQDIDMANQRFNAMLAVPRSLGGLFR